MLDIATHPWLLSVTGARCAPASTPAGGLMKYPENVVSAIGLACAAGATANFVGLAVVAAASRHWQNTVD